MGIGLLGFRVLGEVQAYDERGVIGLGAARQQAVLAVFLTEPGAAVAVDVLVDRVWGAAPPAQARRTLHSYVSRLRSVLCGADGPVLVRRGGSYVLQIDPAAVDMHRFRALIGEARAAADDGQAAVLWQDALALWQGRPFGDLDSDWLRTVAVQLEGEYLAAMLDRTDVLLRRGEHARLVPELAAATDEYPLDERLAGQLMRALYRCGRQADALARYRSLHERLVEELGSNPGPALQELHQRILRQDPDLESPAGGEAPERNHSLSQSREPSGAAVGAPHRPAQLPADVAGFTGRGADLRRLDDLVGGSAGSGSVDRGSMGGGSVGEQAAAVVITAIGGTAGVGKTALAVHWAHRVADRFPDGQLYVNLRGYDPEQPMPPAEALAGFLAALGVPGQNIPLDVEERAARYRSELAGRRMLIVLDNAATVAQVRPLLPGSGSCLVVVTSRDSLAGLVAVHGARRLDLDLLPLGEAVGLLGRLIGQRVESEPEAAATLAEQCVRLPLALRVAAELAVSRPDSSLAELAGELADRRARLELLDAGGDPYAAVREVFSWSVQQLPPEAARTFRLLGLHPGPDLDPYAAAALADTTVADARRVVEVLARAHLVHRTGRARYGMHDLLRAYAAQLCAAEETDQQRSAAERRLLDHYHAAAIAAMDTLHPAEAHYRPDVPAAAALVPDLSDPEVAQAWLEAERFCLVAAAAHAAAQGESTYVVGLSRILHRYLSEGHLTDMLTINNHAQRAAAQAGDPIGEAHALRQLGMAYNRLAKYDLAIDHSHRALARFRRAGDLVGEALTLTTIGVINYRVGDHKRAIEDHRRTIALARETGDQLLEAFGLNNLGVVQERVGHYPEAADHDRQAVVRFRQLGSHFLEALALSNLANVELRQGKYPLAADHLRESLAILKGMGSPVTAGHTFDTLGLLHVRLGEPEQAAGYFQEALTRYRQARERPCQAWSLNGLAEAALLAGDTAKAQIHYTEALEIAVESLHRHQEARANYGLGHVHRGEGDLDRARSCYEQAYAIYTELDMPDAEDVLVYLGLLPGD